MMKPDFLRTTLAALILLSFLGMVARRAEAATPGLVNFQGRLTNTAGDPVADGLYLIKFQIYDAPAGGLVLWNSGYQSVQVSGGIYTYLLGQDVPFPNGLFVGGSRWLGITVGVDPELSPRRQLVATAYAIVSQTADSVNWSGIRGVPAGFADGIDDAGSGDITAVNTSGGLTGGTASGDANISIANGGVTSGHIGDGQIVDADISAAANISPGKIAGGMATLTGSQTFSGTNTFNNALIVGDSTARLDNTSIAIGRITAGPNALLSARRKYDDTFFNYGLYSWLENASTGTTTALYGFSKASTPGFSYSGVVQGVYARGESDGSERYGVRALARTLSGSGAVNGNTYGVYSQAYNGATTYGVYAEADSSGSLSYGVYGLTKHNYKGYGTVGTSYANSNDGYGAVGSATGNLGSGYGVYGNASTNSVQNWAGYFTGDVNVTGNVFMPAKFTEIDHPLDPENQTLRLAGVDSPEQKVIYDGVVTTDANGEAVVAMPPYFDALNAEFRYQLTVIGEFAQAIVLRKLDHGRFTIKTDKPNLEVSWQVTGVRKDAFAIAHPTQVEMPKRLEERGTYLQPDAFGQPRERGVDQLRHGQLRQPQPEPTAMPEPTDNR